MKKITTISKPIKVKFYTKEGKKVVFKGYKTMTPKPQKEKRIKIKGYAVISQDEQMIKYGDGNGLFAPDEYYCVLSIFRTKEYAEKWKKEKVALFHKSLIKEVEILIKSPKK